MYLMFIKRVLIINQVILEIGNAKQVKVFFSTVIDKVLEGEQGVS